jgi:hypothetical protein
VESKVSEIKEMKRASYNSYKKMNKAVYSVYKGWQCLKATQEACRIRGVARINSGEVKKGLLNGTADSREEYREIERSRGRNNSGEVKKEIKETKNNEKISPEW